MASASTPAPRARMSGARCVVALLLLLLAPARVAAQDAGASAATHPINIPGITPLDDGDVSSIGNGLWVTVGGYPNPTPPPAFFPSAKTPLPLTRSEAIQQGWQQTSEECIEKLGYKYSMDASGPTEDHPLELFYNEAGQISGTRATTFGLGPAEGTAGDGTSSLVINNKFWLPAEDDGEVSTWYMSVSFRGPDQLCATQGQEADFEAATETLGDRLVINQDDIARHIPLTAAGAIAKGHQPGSCLKSMGQHFPFDLSTAGGKISFQESNLMPIVPMYYPPDLTGKLTAFFYAVPLAQSPAIGTWDNPPLTPEGMCGNFCTRTEEDGMTDQCHWESAEYWNTMHVYLNSQFDSIVCPGGDEATSFARTCPMGGVDNNAIVVAGDDESSATALSAARLIVVVATTLATVLLF